MAKAKKRIKIKRRSEIKSICLLSNALASPFAAKITLIVRPLFPSTAAGSSCSYILFSLFFSLRIIVLGPDCNNSIDTRRSQNTSKTPIFTLHFSLRRLDCVFDHRFFFCWFAPVFFYSIISLLCMISYQTHILVHQNNRPTDRGAKCMHSGIPAFILLLFFFYFPLWCCIYFIQ